MKVNTQQNTADFQTGCTAATLENTRLKGQRHPFKTVTRPKRLTGGFVILCFILQGFFNALQNYSVGEHLGLYWIEFNNLKVLKVCTVQLHHLGK